MVCHHLPKFGDHRYCTSRDIKFLVCHVIKKDQMIKGSGDYIKGMLPPFQVWWSWAMY